MRDTRTSGTEELELWYELSRILSKAAGTGRRASTLGFTVALITGALVLLSALPLGEEWIRAASPAVALGAAAIPVAAGLLTGGGLFIRERARVRGRSRAVGRALSELGADPRRPARDGLGAYYDAQLVLLRSEYEHLRLRKLYKTARIFERSFGFDPEDPFETGPLNTLPDTERMRGLRQRWEQRLAARRESGLELPALGIREDAAYRVFPREMTVPAELAARRAYLEISRDLIRKRYGRNPRERMDRMPAELRRRVERDLREHAALTEKPPRR